MKIYCLFDKGSPFWEKYPQCSMITAAKKRALLLACDGSANPHKKFLIKQLQQNILKKQRANTALCLTGLLLHYDDSVLYFFAGLFISLAAPDVLYWWPAGRQS